MRTIVVKQVLFRAECLACHKAPAQSRLPRLAIRLLLIADCQTFHKAPAQKQIARISIRLLLKQYARINKDFHQIRESYMVASNGFKLDTLKVVP